MIQYAMRQHIHGGKPFVIAKNVSPKEWEMTLNIIHRNDFSKSYLPETFTLIHYRILRQLSTSYYRTQYGSI